MTSTTHAARPTSSGQYGDVKGKAKAGAAYHREKVGKETRKDISSDKPLNSAQSRAAHAKAAKDEDARKDQADRTLERLPAHENLEIADGKIYRYAYNAAGKSSAGKAQGFEALGHKIQPGGFAPPIPEDIRLQGEIFASSF